MPRLEELEARHEGLRERDRTIASLQSKQRMMAVFEHLLDDEARAQIEQQLRDSLEEVRANARTLALELAQMVWMELAVRDLQRIREQMRRLEAYLDEKPSERLDCCNDLLVYLQEREELRQVPRLRPVED